MPFSVGESPADLVRPDGCYQGGDALFTPEIYALVHETVWEVVSTHEHTGVAVPEPTSCALIAIAVACLVAWRRKDRRP